MALRFPSLDYLALQARQSFMRFPLTIISSLAGVIIAIFLVETENQTFNRFPYINAMLCAALGISLYFCVAVFSHRQHFNRSRHIIAQLCATAVLVGIYFSLPNADSTHNIAQPYIRFALYSAIIHLLVSFIPFLFTYQLNGFWNYNKALFLRFLTSVLYSGFLYVGLVLALFALKVLFNVKIPDELFFELFIVIGGLFNTWFFVAGVPLDFDQLERVTTYPTGLKIFSQFVLLPLLVLYLLILYGYGIKIILSWNWPEGIVSYLVMVVSVLGILTILLIYPYALHTENQWIRKVSKGYYGLLLPLLILLFLAIGMRLADYGFTINRYFILTIGIWLTIVCFYFLSGRNNIKFVPISLAAVLLLISFGPWSIFSVSERSQVNRLEAVLTKGDLMSGNNVLSEAYWVQDSLPSFYSPQEKMNEGQLNDSLHNEVYSILNYLDEYHGFTTIQAWYEQPLDSMINIAEADTSRSRWNRVSEPEVYMKTLGLSYQYKSKRTYDRYFTYNSGIEKALDVKGYDRLLYLGELYYYRQYYQEDKPVDSTGFSRTVEIKGDIYSINYSPIHSDWLSIYTFPDTLYFPLGKHIRKLTGKYGHESNNRIPVAELSIDTTYARSAYRLILNEIEFSYNNDSITLHNISGQLLIGEK